MPLVKRALKLIGPQVAVRSCWPLGRLRRSNAWTDARRGPIPSRDS